MRFRLDRAQTKPQSEGVLLRILSRDTVPPADLSGRHFRYRHAETGHVSSASDFSSWVTAAKDHRRANGLPIPADFTSQMEAQLCQELPAEWCAQNGKATVDLGFSAGDVLDWFKVVALRLWSGAALVTQDEANRRARICSQCPNNMDVAGCGNCSKLAQYLTPGMLTRSTPYDATLKNCSVCRCYNRLQAWFPLAVLLSEETSEKQAFYPDFCWKQPAGHNFIAP